MATKASDRKMSDLYAGLEPIERARLLARLWRGKKGAELDRLRAAVPDDRAGRAYNEALAVLRGVNSGFVIVSMIEARTGFERDYFALVAANVRGYREDAARATLSTLIDLIVYPLTQSEYAAIVKRERATLLYVPDWADLMWDESGLRPELEALMVEFVGPYSRGEVSEDERDAWLERYYARVVGEVRAAISRGELPKPRPPKGHAGELWLPDGALSDWAKGTTEATYPVHAMNAAPALEFFLGYAMRCDVFPDNELERVRAGRAKLREALVRLGHYELHIPEDKLARLSLEPVRSDREREKASDYAASLWAVADNRIERGEALRALMRTFGERKAALRALTDTLDLLQRNVFGGEDPLDEDARPMLAAAWEAAEAAERSMSVYRGIPTEGDEPWPELESEAVYKLMREKYEGYMRGGGD